LLYLLHACPLPLLSATQPNLHSITINALRYHPAYLIILM
jgi:hypothetical protein